MIDQTYPTGWDAERVERLLAHYDEISEDGLVAEDEEVVREQSGRVVISVPEDLLPAIRKLITDQKSA